MSDLNMIHIDPETRRVTFRLNKVPAKSTGLEALLQLCVKTVLSTSGRDFLRPEYGGNILTLSGYNLNKSMLPKLYAEIAYIVSHSEQLILKEQAGKNLKKEDALKHLTLINIEVDMLNSSVVVTMRVTNEAGRSTDFVFDSAVSN